ncbi:MULTISPECIES: YtxH domain-containing protein [unclassified Bacillus (in: firmicutes)]|uniref:YtxH domain-containing protein n=1 Tax=unclassified Bacillus (in: firmicutes) TaxID=185979 RepID=UPI0008DF9A9E|nr:MULTISPECIES: YtxH domain-containing protein [unclassified Bacillus (in: firmicutes)]SFB17798.1 Gas vesicle protein [Bacillus sp. UNCCL13]SFQ76624.1 Gas vesicle protein [Bacillus sp. cl95]
MLNNQNDRNESNLPQEEEAVNMKNFAVGAVIGGLVGAAAAVFLAPKSGKELRNDLTEQAGVLKEKTSQLRETAMTKGTEIVSMAKEKAEKLNLISKSDSTDSVQAVDTLNDDVTLNETEVVEASVSEEVENSTTPFDDLTLKDDNDVRQKLEEAKAAFEEEESKVKL